MPKISVFEKPADQECYLRLVEDEEGDLIVQAVDQFGSLISNIILFRETPSGYRLAYCSNIPSNTGFDLTNRGEVEHL